jgi:hypothetical protein
VKNLALRNLWVRSEFSFDLSLKLNLFWPLGLSARFGDSEEKIVSRYLSHPL